MKDSMTIKMTEEEKTSMALYIAYFLREEIDRNNIEYVVDNSEYLIDNAIDAYLGGAR